jgi:hypothetical protein
MEAALIQDMVVATEVAMAAAMEVAMGAVTATEAVAMVPLTVGGERMAADLVREEHQCAVPMDALSEKD